jgi:hypothetical protein
MCRGSPVILTFKFSLILKFNISAIFNDKIMKQSMIERPISREHIHLFPYIYICSPYITFIYFFFF